MRTYDSYKAEDFLNDDSFIAWVAGGDAAATAFWTQWLALGQPSRGEALLAKDLLEAMRQSTGEPAEDTVEQEADFILQRIREPARSGRLFFRRSFWWSAAAVLSVVLGLGWLAGKSYRPVASVSARLSSFHPAGPEMIERVNRTDKPIRLPLPDGSRVTLQPRSLVRYGTDFERAVRAVTLKGEAFFEVVPNPKIPFLVYANQVVTRVVGTSFVVKAEEGASRVLVAVRTGRVTVYSRNELEQRRNAAKPEVAGVILMPNQQVVFHEKEAVFRKGLVDKPAVVAEAADSLAFEFEETPIPDVFRRIGRAYQIEIVYQEQALRKCNLTASLTGLSLYEQLRMISKTLGGSYEVTDGKILILATGCGE